jgi:hypothetical protein
MKKLVVTVTMLSFMNLVGCYYQEQMNPSDFNFNDNEDMQLITKDTTYNLGGRDYYYDNDTLIATFSKPLDERTKLKYTINIPVNSIEMIEVKKMDTLNTTILIGIIVLTVVGLVTLFSLGDNYSSSGLLGTSK